MRMSGSKLHVRLCMPQARSWLNETVLVPFRGHEMALALNVALNLRKLSYDHTLLLALDQASCLRAAGALPDIGARSTASHTCCQCEPMAPSFGLCVHALAARQKGFAASSNTCCCFHVLGGFC